MMPLGFHLRTSSLVTSQGGFAVDAELAHAARDELGVLGAEVEDQDARGVDSDLPTR